LSGNVTRHDIITKRNAVSINEAAEYLGVSHKTIRRMISRGDLAAYRYRHNTPDWITVVEGMTQAEATGRSRR
jgi:excisionase family DNA binding protein